MKEELRIKQEKTKSMMNFFVLKMTSLIEEIWEWRNQLSNKNWSERKNYPWRSWEP